MEGAGGVYFQPPSREGGRREVPVEAMYAGCRVVSFERGVMGDGDENGNEGGMWRIVRFQIARVVQNRGRAVHEMWTKYLHFPLRAFSLM